MQDAGSRSLHLPHSLVALVVLLCAATGTVAHLVAASAAGVRLGLPDLPGGLAAELPLLAAASVVWPVGTLLLDGLLGMPLPDLVSPAALVLTAASLLLAGGGRGSAAPGQVARRSPGCRSLRPGSGSDLRRAWPNRARPCIRRPGGPGSAASPG